MRRRCVRPSPLTSASPAPESVRWIASAMCGPATALPLRELQSCARRALLTARAGRPRLFTAANQFVTVAVQADDLFHIRGGQSGVEVVLEREELGARFLAFSRANELALVRGRSFAAAFAHKRRDGPRSQY